MEKLTQRQQQVLDIIRQHIDGTGYPPTRADIAKELGFKSANAAEEHLKALARKGAIEMVAGASRGIRLPESAGIPIIGRVAAGNPRPRRGAHRGLLQSSTELFQTWCRLLPDRSGRQYDRHRHF